MADGRRKRGTAKHAGVVLKRRALPSGAVSWRARYRDPDTGSMVYETLPARLTTEEQRSAWAVDKARELATREEALARGAAKKTGTTLAEAVETFYREHAARLRKSTVTTYRYGTEALTAWAAEKRIISADDLRPEHLEAFRATMFARPRKVQAPGERRGARRESEEPRSVVSVNSRLRAVKTVLESPG